MCMCHPRWYHHLQPRIHPLIYSEDAGPENCQIKLSGFECIAPLQYFISLGWAASKMSMMYVVLFCYRICIAIMYSVYCELQTFVFMSLSYSLGLSSCLPLQPVPKSSYLRGTIPTPCLIQALAGRS